MDMEFGVFSFVARYEFITAEWKTMDEHGVADQIVI